MTFEATLDRRLVRAGTRSVRHLLVRVTAPSAVAGQPRAPLRIAFVIDRSGSMAGSKLTLASRAVSHAIGLLGARDRFAIVVYDDRVDVLVAETAATVEAVAEARAALDRVRPGGTTNLSEGWLVGCDQVARESPESLSRALLLSDGLANVGLTDADELAHHAEQLRARGIVTTTFGLGADFDEALLQSVATSGGGNFYFIEAAPQIRDFFASELGEALEIVAPCTRLELDVAPEVEVLALSALARLGDMPLDAQTRLLRVLQEGEIIPVGGLKAQKVDVRIIAATHRNLRQMVTEGLFREDLFFRLNVVPMRLPPLRERKEDIPLLMRHFLLRAMNEGLPSKSITPAAMRRLKMHDWPGNVRELENLARRLAALHAEEIIEEDAIESELSETESSPGDAAVAGLSGPPAKSSEESLSLAVERHLSDYFAAHDGALPPAGLYNRVLREIERPLLTISLVATGGNQLKAAKLLGLNRNTLRKKIRELDIQVIRGLRQDIDGTE